MRQINVRDMSLDVLRCYKFYNIMREGEMEKITDCYRLLFVEEGSIEVLSEGVKYSLRKGEAFFLPAGTRYKTIMRDKVDIYGIFFGVVQEESKLFSRRGYYSARVEFIDAQVLNSPAKLSCSLQFRSVIMRMFEEYRSEKVYYKEYIDNLMESLVLMALRDGNNGTADNYPQTAEKIIEYIDSHISEKLTCSSLSEIFNYHPNHINRLIKRATGKPVSFYIQDVRLRHAEIMLGETEMSITEISHALNYNSSSHFGEAFKKRFGVSPREYRNIIQKQI